MSALIPPSPSPTRPCHRSTRIRNAANRAAAYAPGVERITARQRPVAQTLRDSRMTDDANDGAPRSALLRLVRGLWVSRALWVAAKLGIADLLSEGSRSGAELAAATATHAPSLRRVLRVLCGARVLVQDDAERFGLTPVGALLRSGTPDSLRAWTTMALGDEYYQAWGALMQTVRTGDVAFDHVFGDDVWMYRASHAEHAALFD